MNFLFEKNNLTRKKIIESVILYNKLSGDENIENLSEEEQNKILQKIEIFFICSKEIEKIDNLAPYTNLKELYLRNNYINEIRGLNTLINLKVLNLQYNMIHKIKNISHLINLEVLDISENDIYDFDSNQLPENLIYLYFYYNPFFELYDKDKIFIYRSQIIQKCIKIERIDKLDVRDRERLLLFDEKKIKNKKKFSLNSLSYVFQHYEQFEIDNNKKIEMYELMDSIANLLKEDDFFYDEYFDFCEIQDMIKDTLNRDSIKRFDLVFILILVLDFSKLVCHKLDLKENNTFNVEGYESAYNLFLTKFNESQIYFYENICDETLDDDLFIEYTNIIMG